MEQWPVSERPRERLYCNGADALADAELLALQLGSGRRGHTAVDVAREMLAAYGSLAGVASRELAELARLPGVGRAKAARLVSAFELTRRLRARTPGARIGARQSGRGPRRVRAAHGGPAARGLPHRPARRPERPPADLIVSEGTLSASLVHPREVFKPAILEPAASIILLHNHPSGDPTPSREDIRLTRQLVECARLLDLRIHDHVVIGRGRYVSLAERGII